MGSLLLASYFSLGSWHPLPVAIEDLPAEIVIGIDDEAAFTSLTQQHGFRGLRALRLSGAYLARFRDARSALFAANTLVGAPGVRYAHPNFATPKEFRSHDAPDTEPFFTYQRSPEN